ncbi:MAG: hypothetical protein QOF78_1922 [Phycisphaerales bacterium]|jgi:hypothetical protein|nr:hypothetical protein [Phycisphaerales bacterium]
MTQQNATSTRAANDAAADEKSRGPTIDAIADRADKLLHVERARYRRLWAYCRNPMRVAASDGDGADRPYRQAQEWGLPSRITGSRSSTADVFGGELLEEVARKEVVIENDIGWRVDTLVDYLFGRPLVIESAAPDPQRRAMISELLRQILGNNGGILLLQQLALVGSVYGFVDVLVKLDASRCDSDPVHTAGCNTRELGRAPAAARAAKDVTLPDGAGPSVDGVVGQCDHGDATLRAESASSSSEPVARASGAGADGLDDAIQADRAASGNDSHPASSAATAALGSDELARFARMIRLEVVEPARVLPFLSGTDWREIVAYGQCYEVSKSRSGRVETASGAAAPWYQRLARLANPVARFASNDRDHDVVVDLITPTRWLRYENEKLRAEGENSLGRIPLVHVQNTALPMEYSGASDVEPLIPLQDELNTRLSDRAHRITLQSFKMYLGKNIDNFTSMPVSPGRMWMSDNESADVVEFGGDAACPSEDAHISEIREALDKTSGVTPIAAGAIKGRIGRLTSAAALRITLQALLAKTEKKRTTYGAAIAQICELSLAWLDRAGLFTTTAEERRIELNWSSPVPENALEKLQEAEAKARLGVPREIVLRELGY